MKKAKFCLFVLAFSISLPFAAYLSKKLTWNTVENILSVEFKSQTSLVPDVFYQKTVNLPYTAEQVVSSFHKDLKTGTAVAKFIFPKGKLYVVRLDFGSKPGNVEVTKLTFRNENITSDILKKSNFQNISGIQFPDDMLMKFNAVHEDPYIVFPSAISQEVNLNIWIFLGILAIIFTATSAILFLLVKLIKRFEAQKKA